MPEKADGIAALSQKGFANKEWTDKLGEDGILKSVGFRRSNSSYLETVFNTLDKIKYLEYVVIDDDRTTPICRRLGGTKLPRPFCATYTPPTTSTAAQLSVQYSKASVRQKPQESESPKTFSLSPKGLTQARWIAGGS